MQLNLKQHKRLKEQAVNVQNGLTVLVGTNGSGKSSFLERLFFDNILGNIMNQTPFENCVVYSSGVNESFTPMYQGHLKALYNQSLKLVSDHQSAELNLRGKYYFSKEWAPFLLLVTAFMANEDSNTSKWMRQFGLSAVAFDFEIYLPSSFKNNLKQAYKNIEEGRADYGFESSQLVKFLNILSDGQFNEVPSQSKLKISWGSTENLTPSPNSITGGALYTQLFDSGIFTSADKAINPVNKFFQMTQVLSFGGSRSKFIPLESTKIIFNRSGQLINLRDLSDGEFQILINAALLDLFDAPNSLFLLDEVDAHIHPTIIKRVWSSFASVKGYAFTSSHNLLTISNSEYNRIIFLEDGTIISDVARKVKLVDDICGTLFGGPVFKSVLYSIENLVLIDDYRDWDIFKELMLKRGKDFSNLESKTLICKKSSGTNRNLRDDLVNPKMTFVDELKNVAHDAQINPDQIKIKNIFLLCDADSYIFQGTGLDIKSERISVGSKPISIHSIIWNRRYIESYLISPIARAFYDQSPAVSFCWGNIPEYGQLTESVMNETNKKRVQCKEVVRKFVGKIESDKLREYVNRMSNDDIDPYMVNVFDKICEIISPS